MALSLVLDFYEVTNKQEDVWDVNKTLFYNSNAQNPQSKSKTARFPTTQLCHFAEVYYSNAQNPQSRCKTARFPTTLLCHFA